MEEVHPLNQNELAPSTVPESFIFVPDFIVAYLGLYHL